VLWIAGIFSLLTAAAGWFYLFYSRAAEKLVGVEGARVNARRIRLRRVGGSAMILLGAAFYVACAALVRKDLSLFSGMMLAVLALMAVTLVLGLMDLRLTRKLRKNNKGTEGNESSDAKDTPC
jgi:peptidoglycan/LPS O-acetylase OafA/YrhL